MGFDDSLAKEAISSKCQNINECIEYINLKQSAIEAQKIEEKQIEEKQRHNIMDRFVSYVPVPTSEEKNDYINFNSFEFGVTFNYWDKKSPQYTPKNHENLRQEMLNNKNGKGDIDGNGQFRITEDEWNEFLRTAVEKYHIMYDDRKDNHAQQIKPLYAKDKGHLNKVFNIKPGSKLSIDHILSIILYTDTEELQNCLKKQCRKINMIHCICGQQLDKISGKKDLCCYRCIKKIDDENAVIYHCKNTQNEKHKHGYDLCVKCADKQMISEVATRNSEYHNWLRLLSEVVYLFGDGLLPNQSVYCGISIKLLFDSFDVCFKTPLSTTTSIAVAQRFAFGGGIILELVNGGSRNEHCISVDVFSEYSEREMLFFGCHLKVKSIIINSEEIIHYKKEIILLNIYMSILNGSILNTVDLRHELNECKNDLIIFIDNHISILKTGKGNNDKANKDEYILQLFLNCTAANKRIWINLNQIKYLQNFFDSNISNKFILFEDNDSMRHKFGEYLQLLSNSASLNLDISIAAECKWIIQKKKLKKLLNGKFGQHGLLSNDYWPIYVDNDKTKLCVFKGNMTLNGNRKSNDHKIGFCMVLVQMPKTYQSIHVSYQLYCKQIDFKYVFPENIMSTKSDSKYGFNNLGNAQLFNASQLNALNTFEWTIVIKCYCN